MVNPPTTQMVEQVDRDTAAELANEFHFPVRSRAILLMESAFARHRHQTTRPTPVADRATVLSEWIDRDMLVNGREFQAGQVTVADILDHAAASAKLKAEVRAALHEWEPKPSGASQCTRCGAVAWSMADLRTKCTCGISARLSTEAQL